MVATSKRTRRPKMTDAQRFFWLNAGMSYTPGAETPAEGRRRCAESYAADEAWLRTIPHHIEWNHDNDADRSWMDGETFNDDGRPLWELVIRAQLPGDDSDVDEWTVEACGGIDIGFNSPRGNDADPYARVMAAELAGELRAEAEKRDADRTAYTNGTVQAIAAGIFTDKAYDRCPAMADALEDAGHVYAADLKLLRSGIAHINHEYTRRRQLRELVIRVLAANELPGVGDLEHGYLSAALWTSTGDDGQPLDTEYTRRDFAPSTLVNVRAECAAFLRLNADAIGEQYDDAGHDFWLTRNGHGVGFWAHTGKGERWENVGDVLTDSANTFGEMDVSVGDDGQLYISPG